MKVVLSGIIYPFTMLHFFWYAFERRDDIDLQVCGPFTGSYIPWNNGITLPQKYVKMPDLPLPQRSITLRPDPLIIEAQLPWEEPDLWLQVDAGWHVRKRPKAKVVAHVQTDPHVLKKSYATPKSYSDFNFCMQSAYMETGETYLPYAYDPTIHYPIGLDKKYDGCMIGLQYDHRMNLVKRLTNKGYNVYNSIGEVYDEYRERYNRSRVAISWSSLNDTPARVFEALGMRLPLLCNRTPDLSTFFVEGEHYLGFSDVDEAVRQFVRLMEDEDLREGIAGAGYRKAEAGHKWDYRVNQILEICGLKS